MIKDKIIKWLGGFTINDFKIFSPKIIRVTTKSYYVDEDTITYEKTQIARKIGEMLLDYNMIYFDIEPKDGEFGETLYTIRGEIQINEEQKA